MKEFAGRGRKRPQLNIKSTRLCLDPYNPRLPELIQGKTESDLLKYIKKAYYLEELAQSMIINGYLDEEPLVAIPKKLPKKFNDIDEVELMKNSNYIDFIENEGTIFTVVEGNRRLSTVKLLLDNNFQNYEINQQIREDLEVLPVIIYPKRDSVLTYLGVRHINPVRKWGAYEKARYIAQMIEKYNISIDYVQKSIGDTSNSARKTYCCYRLIELMENEFEYNSVNAKEKFSFLMLATGQGAIKRYIGLTEKWGDIDFDNIIPKSSYEKLKLFFKWIYGDSNSNSLIRDSRNITKKLSPILNSSISTTYLEESDDLEGAYDRCDGDEVLLNKYFNKAIQFLDKSIPIVVDKGLTDEGRAYIIKLEKRLTTLKNISSNG